MALPLNELLGRTLAIRFDGRITCQYCGNVTRKSYGEGYCYPCFKTLARCDLCVVSPDRCHYAARHVSRTAVGRELLYAAAPRVSRELGRARRWASRTPANVPMRWLDQGATQAVVVMRTQSRFQAGCVEAALARHVSDRTEWRNLVGRDAQRARSRGADASDCAARRPTRSPRWNERFPRRACVGGKTRRRCGSTIRSTSYAGPPIGLSLEPGIAVGGTLLGIKGQYLMFDSGVFNVRRHTSYHVDVTRAADIAPDGRGQMELF